ncbi:CubicO group peptidase (beta-lactamase class C family) [Actinopolyspora biskrensis]|uniref:CubicO group peptidase (Beta-lactamase class C family) n=1 Tax=Actinopolyspora biskrensis TaxID=1470178 RepID=A0A852YVD7_9ACTN|nr:serine hydrolase domain-containing protein [Actinopolyspora biskrensis]NYH77682.1 CubicO group peptidase (beta-lactamase class C family) [Actinopolyspora biskrensis]
MSALTRRGFLGRLGTGIAGMTMGGSTASAAEARPRSHDGLVRGSPEELGVDPGGILDFAEGLERAGFAGHGFVLLRHGRVAAEGWWEPYTPDAEQLTYSLTKSVLGTAVGFAVDEGRIRLEDRIVDALHDLLPARVSANLAAMRLRHLLTMTAGHAADPMAETRLPRSEPSTEWVRALLSVPVEHAPGTHFTYSNGAAILAAAMLHRAVGRSARNYLEPRLFAPLGIRVGYWEEFPDGVSVGSSGLALRTGDIAKFGQTYLRRGVWNGEQVVPRFWAEQATGKRIDTPARGPDESAGYGYLFWRGRHNTFRGHGALDQCSIVMPDQDAVLATTAERHGTVLDLAWRTLLPAMGAAPSVPVRRLDRKLAALRLPVARGDTSPRSCGQYCGSYVFAANELGLERITLDITRDRCTVEIVDARGSHSVVCGLGRWIESTSTLSASSVLLPGSTVAKLYRAPPETRVAASAAWPSADTLRMVWRFVETPHADTVTLGFGEDSVEVEFESSVSRRGQGTDNRPVLAGSRQR